MAGASSEINISILRFRGSRPWELAFDTGGNEAVVDSGSERHHLIQNGRIAAQEFARGLERDAGCFEAQAVVGVRRENRNGRGRSYRSRWGR